MPPSSCPSLLLPAYFLPFWSGFVFSLSALYLHLGSTKEGSQGLLASYYAL